MLKKYVHECPFCERQYDCESFQHHIEKERDTIKKVFG